MFFRFGELFRAPPIPLGHYYCGHNSIRGKLPQQQQELEEESKTNVAPPSFAYVMEVHVFICRAAFCNVTIRHGSPRVPRQGSGRAVTSSVYPYCRFFAGVVSREKHLSPSPPFYSLYKKSSKGLKATLGSTGIPTVKEGLVTLGRHSQPPPDSNTETASLGNGLAATHLLFPPSSSSPTLETRQETDK